MSPATARALADNLLLLERDRQQEQRCLDDLCCWAYSISPSLYPYRDDSLMLEIGSCLSLYGGLTAILQRVQHDLASRGYSYRSAVAATPKAAWLLSHSDQNDPQADLKQQLAPLPLKLLDLFQRQVESLAKAGLWRFQDLLQLPATALARRCGVEMTHYLEQVLGSREDLQPEFKPPPTFSDQYWFGYEVKANQELLPAIQLLLQSWCLFLRNTQLQGQHVQWQLYGIDHQTHSFDVRSSLSHASWKEWYSLTCLKVDQLQLNGSIEGVGLSSDTLKESNGDCGDLFTAADQREPLNSLLDRLKSRLGLQAVARIGCREEHLPEFAGYCNADQNGQTVSGSKTTTATTTMSAAVNTGERPFWLLPQPQPLRQHDQQLYWNGRLSLITGPERIEDNWWQEPVSRDYYIARDPSGQPYWVYHDRQQKQWFMQGIFP